LFLFVEGEEPLKTEGESFKLLLNIVLDLLTDVNVLKSSSALVISKSHTINTKLLVKNVLKGKLDESLFEDLGKIFL
jgi:hypothetical protein